MTAIVIAVILLAAFWAALMVESGKILNNFRDTLDMAAFMAIDSVTNLKVTALTLWFASPALWIWVPKSQTLLTCVWVLGLILYPFWKFRQQRHAMTPGTRFAAELVTALVTIQVLGMVAILAWYNALFTPASAMMTALGLLAQMVVTVVLVAPLMEKRKPLTH
jgi:hypothetical protein